MKYTLFVILLFFTTYNAVSQSTKELFTNATSDYESGNYDQALEKLSNMVEIMGSSNSRIQYLKVKCYYQLREFETCKEEIGIYMGMGRINSEWDKEIDEIQEYIANAEKDSNPPSILVFNPNISSTNQIVEFNEQLIISGRVTDESGIKDLLINGAKLNVDNQGNFSKTVTLSEGLNSFSITAIDTFQNKTNKDFTVQRQSNQNTSASTPIVAKRSQELTSNKESNPTSNEKGIYYALIIGNNEYQDPNITSLDQPINDATKLYDVLTTNYTFRPENVFFLKNATYVQMIDAFDNLSNKITKYDNLLVFYAGHGWWDDNKGLGYWLPANAKKSSTAFWIRNSTISDYMGSINSKHTLLIADACFSGSIFKTRAAFADADQAIKMLFRLPSRSAMTSGNLKEVPDNSVFLEYLVKRLKENEEQYLTAEQLFVSFRIAVMNNSHTEPQFGTIQNAGDEGGEFIFIKK